MERNRKIFAVCDLDEQYVVRLTGYLNQKKATPFEVLAFTSLDSLSAYAGDHPIEVLLISPHAMNSKVRDLNVGRIMILSEGDEADLDLKDPGKKENADGIFEDSDDGDEEEGINVADYPAVSKYQSTDSLAREVMNYYSEGKDIPSASFEASGVSVYAVHSPVSRCGKTMFSLALAEILGEEKKTLYLNMENYSGFEALFGQTYQSDISDLIYISGKEKGSLPMKLESIVRTMRNADYIPPAFFPGDLLEASSKEVISFLAAVADIGEYRNLVLDIGTGLSDAAEILAACTRIYMPVLPDPLSRAKVSQFEKNMEALSRTSVTEKAVRLYLPEVKTRATGMQLLEKLVTGPMGVYTRKLLSEQAQAADTVHA